MKLKKFKTFESKLNNLINEIELLLPLGITVNNMNICTINSRNPRIEEYLNFNDMLAIDIDILEITNRDVILDFITQVGLEAYISYSTNGFDTKCLKFNIEILNKEDIYLEHIVFIIAENNFEIKDILEILNITDDLELHTNDLLDVTISSEMLSVFSVHRLSDLPIWSSVIDRFKHLDLSELIDIDDITNKVIEDILDKWVESYNIHLGVHIDYDYEKRKVIFSCDDLPASIRDIVSEYGFHLNRTYYELIRLILPDTEENYYSELFKLDNKTLLYIIDDIIEENI